MTPPTSFENYESAPPISTAQQAEAHVASGRHLLNAHAPERALEQLRAALTLDPEHAEAHSLLALCLSRLQRTDAALHEAHLGLQFAPNRAWCHYVHGAVLSDAGRYGEARDAIERARALAPGNYVYPTALARLLNIMDKPREAEVTVRQALDLNPQHADAHLVLGHALVDTPQRHEEAGAHYQAALQLDPDDADMHHGMALWHLRGKRPAQAVVAAREALRLHPQHRGAKQTFMAAQGAKNPFFKLFWAWTLWVTKFSPGVRIGIIIGLWASMSLLDHWADAHPKWATTANVVSWVYVAFCVYTWVAPGLLRWWLKRSQPF